MSLPPPPQANEPHAKSAKTPLRSARSRAREFAVQALYQHLVGAEDTPAIDTFTRDLSGFHKCDAAHYDALLYGCVAQKREADALLQTALDRPLVELSPIEHVVLWIGVYEFLRCPEVPWRVVLNECVELAKSFGGTDGHKYVNGVLNKLAPQLRSAEMAKDSKYGQARQ